MKAPVSHSKDPDLQKAPQALMRASEKARLLAEQTGTTFVEIIRDRPRFPSDMGTE